MHVSLRVTVRGEGKVAASENHDDVGKDRVFIFLTKVSEKTVLALDRV